MNSVTLLPVKQDLFVGIDVGGTKVHLTDTSSTTVHRFRTTDYHSMDALLEGYFQTMGARPTKITIGMAGPRDDDTGEVKLTNQDWPAFNPGVAAEKYQIKFSTTNDMVITAAGVLQETSLNILQLKAGTSTRTGTKLVVSLSTGIGVAAAVWDAYSNRYVIVPSEGGHIGFHPKNAAEQQYLTFLHRKYPHASAELALSGKYGIDNLVDHLLETLICDELTQAIIRARSAGRPVGAVLLEFATVGSGKAHEAATIILGRLGAMLGSILRDLALVYKATGGVYVTGSVGFALGEYFAERTDLIKRFITEGAVHDIWLEKIPIHLITDPNVAVVGALALAKEL